MGTTSSIAPLQSQQQMTLEKEEMIIQQDHRAQGYINKSQRSKSKLTDYYQQQQLQPLESIQQMLQKGFQQFKSSLISKSILVGRRSVSIAQNAGTISSEFLDRQPISHDQKVIVSKGEDTRKKIDQNNKYPFCAIGYISMTFIDFRGQKFDAFGSGCLIHKRLVLTCAHNVYDRQKKVEASQVYFIPAMNGQKGRRYKAIKFYYPYQYKNSTSRDQHQWDFALMELDVQDLSQQYGYLGVNTMINGQQNALIYGYPLDLNDVPGKKWLFGAQGLVWESKKNSQQLNYHIPTAGGQSGSPIIRKAGKNNFEVIGIHIRYIDGVDSEQNSQQNCNSGVKFTDRIKLIINDWIKISNYKLIINKRTFQKANFKNLFSKKWDKWQYLTMLDLSQNNITGQMCYYITSENRRFPNLIFFDLSDNNIDCQGIKHLTNNINAFPNLQQLILNKNKISTKGIKYLIKNHICFPVLSGLFLANNKLNGQSLTELTKNQGAFPLLDNLDLGQNQFAAQQCKNLVKIAEIYPNLTQFGISRNGLQDSGVETLFDNKQAFINASQLGLGNNLITEEGIKQIIKQGKAYYPNLTRLWLENNLIGDGGCKWLTKNGVFPNLFQLNLHSNQIGFKGIYQLIKFQNAFPKLQNLDIKNNMIGNISLKYLSQNYNAMPRLTSLFIDSNDIDDEGIHFLIKHRQAYPDLKILSLKDNKITCEGIKHLMYQCEAFLNLQELSLQKNTIGDKGMLYICECLKQTFKKLKVLGLRDNDLTTQSINHMINYQVNLFNLRTLGLNMNKIDQKGIKLLINLELSLQLPNLKNLWLAGNKLRNSDLQQFAQKYPQIKIK